ncbi:MAG: EAL domain-containing protein [Lachnospiraceae bacterium]|nr:EAL domain-containing protein [Lachnospiraceae bacterium]
MSKNKKSKRKRLGSHRIWITLLFCLIVTIIANIFIVFFASSFASYMMNTKIVDQYEAASYMAKLYENSDDEEGAVELLKEDDKTFFIMDKHGNILYQNGENTMGTTSGKMEISVFNNGFFTKEETIRVYVDKVTEGFLEPNEDGEISIDFGKILAFAQNVPKDSNIKVDIKRTSVEMPIWLAIEVKNGTQIFYSKAAFTVSLSDITFIATFALAGAALVFCVLILMLANMISTLISQRKMRKIFYHDHVTRGHNWMWFMKETEAILKKRKTRQIRFAVIDIVFVKYRNYCSCHSIADGEQMLIKIDKILKQNMRFNEVTAHYGSANFCAMLVCKDDAELKQRIEFIMDQLQKIDNEHRISYHVGVYAIEPIKDKNGKFIKKNEEDIDIEEYYNNACTARSTIIEDDTEIAFFDENLLKEQKWIDTVMDNFDKAIENEEFVVYYQPKFNPKNDELSGVEALIRWDSPEFGFKAPGSFIPILEQNGAIPEIDHYMITHVARDQKKWLDEGYHCVPASVNVSRAHFIENDLAMQIKEAVDKEGCPYHLIEIELTESAFFDDKNAMLDTIKKLKEIGFMVSMDDFGSGYSSLNSLKDMPLDVLKLDAGFFSGSEDDERGEIVVSEALRLARNLKMITVAEGVEHREQVDFLAKHGCDMIQGYIYAKPMPGDEYVHVMKKTEASLEETADSETNEAAGEASQKETLNGEVISSEASEEIINEDTQNQSAE